jgi:Ser/Thr protein kinase RdoA (MazF antagonist)
MDIDTITPDHMRFNPPDFSVEAIAPLIDAAYGLTGVWSPLDGERDQNFKLTSANGSAWVVKIAGPDEAPEQTDFQVQALLYLEAHSPALPVPRLRRTLSGQCLGSVVDDAGTRHAVRVVTFLPGIPYGEGTYPDADHLQHIGSFMGRVVNALAGFEHPASRHFMPWNLANGVAVSQELWDDAESDLRMLVPADLVTRLREQSLPALNALPSQVIHNDGHSYNLLRPDSATQSVCGLIDFGDMVYGPIIDELAVTATVFQRLCPEHLYAVRHLLRGFHRIHPLTDAEVSLLWDAIVLRLLITVLLSDIKVRLGGRSARDALEDRSEAMVMLARAMDADRVSTVNALRAECGYA